jgi:hypothetical protein
MYMTNPWHIQHLERTTEMAETERGKRGGPKSQGPFKRASGPLWKSPCRFGQNEAVREGLSGLEEQL